MWTLRAGPRPQGGLVVGTRLDPGLDPMHSLPSLHRMVSLPWTATSQETQRVPRRKLEVPEESEASVNSSRGQPCPAEF